MTCTTCREAGVTCTAAQGHRAPTGPGAEGRSGEWGLHTMHAGSNGGHVHARAPTGPGLAGVLHVMHVYSP